jgi:hypothetical protein
MRHARGTNKLLEILGSKLRTVVGNDSRRLAWKVFSPALQHNLDILFGHALPQLPMNDVTATAI